jgi:Tol biopolymer transport system component
LAGEADNGAIELSPDDKRAVIKRLYGASSDLWLLELHSGAVSRLTSDGGDLVGDFVWSPDS